jgi:pyruvate/2-oxoglutarate dehydrogenase complex dihydrolipoamide dehydrogenase (E3) component/uncharacterized membrane protein YdjX (TVP38/TMEM64 family)
MRRPGKILLLFLMVMAIALFVATGGTERLSLAGLKQDLDGLLRVVDAWPVASAFTFGFLYVVVTALSLPGAAALTLAAGALFGLVEGTLLASISSTIGATLAMLSARFVARDWVRKRFPKAVEAVDRGLARDGYLYLLSLRLIPVFPFFLVNLAMGLTGMRTAPFAMVSMAGMLPGTLVYVNAGTQLAAIEDTGDILSPALVGSFVLLGLFPLLAKVLVGWWKRRRVYRGWRRPRRFDRNLIVIGAGAGGLVTALIGATVRAKVTLIEKGDMGGDCLNTGCVPSKALIRSARAAHEVRTAAAYGLAAAEPQVRFAEVMERVHRVIAGIAPADSAERYTRLGVDVRKGHARLVDPWTVEIDGGERLTARAIVIAAGGEPAVPDIPGLAESGFLTSDSMWEALRGRETVPERVAIVGGGPIGTEMAQAFARLGSKVTQIENGSRLLPREDEEASALVEAVLREEGVEILAGHEAIRVEGKVLTVRSDRAERAVPFDELIVAVGRKARLGDYGLEALGIETGRTIAVNEWLETRFPNIYAVGDVAGPYQFTHFAAHQAWFAAVNSLFGQLKRFRADYRVLPWVTFTDPEVAHAGHNELSAKEAGVPFEIVRYDLAHLDRALAEGANRGFVKLLVQPGKDRLLGATIVATQAGELLPELVLAMKHGLGLNKLLGTIHAYPTLAEANKYAAGEWKKAHKPERLLAWVERYHDWRRG